MCFLFDKKLRVIYMVILIEIQNFRVKVKNKQTEF